MHIILLSGGSGRRLWPLSSGSRSKQFIKLLKNEDSQIRIYASEDISPNQKSPSGTDIFMTTCADQREIIENQLGDTVDIIQEPERRDTFPAVLLSASYLIYERRTPLDESVAIMPVDACVGDSYFLTIRYMCKAVEQNACQLMLMGVTPSSPSENMGILYLLRVAVITNLLVRSERNQPLRRPKGSSPVAHNGMGACLPVVFPI